jgi:hypothetical protein
MQVKKRKRNELEDEMEENTKDNAKEAAPKKMKFIISLEGVVNVVEE